MSETLCNGAGECIAVMTYNHIEQTYEETPWLDKYTNSPFIEGTEGVGNKFTVDAGYGFWPVPFSTTFVSGCYT